MVATQSQSLGITRRSLDVEDYIDIARRHIGWIIGPTYAGLVISIIVAFALPNAYVSRAAMEIVPAQVSASIVQSTLNSELAERLQQMETEILSRSTLGALIGDPRLQLYKEQLKSRPLEDVIEDMRKDIQITLVGNAGGITNSHRGSAFTIQFTYPDKYKAQQTVATLVNRFTELNQTTEKSAQDMVKGLVGDELTSAKADLDKANNDVMSFKTQNAGKLPEQAAINIAQTNSITQKMQNNADMLFRMRQELTGYEQQKDQIKARQDLLQMQQSSPTDDPLSSVPGVISGPQQDLAAINKQIDGLQFQLDQLSKKFSDQYPEIRDGKKTLEVFKAKRDDILRKIREQEDADAARPKDAPKKVTDPRLAQAQLQYQQQIQDIELRIKALTDNMARLQKEEDGYKAESDAVSQKLKDEPALEAPYDELLRAQKNAQARYQDLLGKQELTAQNSKMIERKAGENLEVLDPASLPSSPAKPNRYMDVGAGFGISVIIGLALAGLQEAKDTSLKNLKDVRAYTNLPVLCSVPLLENTMLVKRKRRLTYLAWSAAVLIGAAAVAASVGYYFTVTMKGGAA